MNKSFHQYAVQLNQQMQHRHMFSHWEINRIRFASRVLFPRPAHYAPEATLMQHVQARQFPSQRLRKRMPNDDQVAFRDKCNGLRLRAEEQEALHPVSFAIGNSWNETLRSDKHHNLEYIARSMTYSRGPFLAAMFLLVFWILFWEPWWSRLVGIRGAPRLTEACPRHAWQELLWKKPPLGTSTCGRHRVRRNQPLWEPRMWQG